MSEKFIESGSEDNYYGIERKFLVKKLHTKEFFTESDTGDFKYVIGLDFGRPEEKREMRTEHMGYTEWDMKDLIFNVTKDVMESGVRGDIVQEVIDKLYNDYEMQITYTSYTKASSWQNHFDMRIFKKDKGDFKDEDLATAEDIKPYLSENERNVEAMMRTYCYYTSQNKYPGEKGIKYLVEKILKERYTYCVKCGKNIVPDKYLEDGEAGIERWRKEKSSSNKNNSIEKQMVRKIRNQKKQCAYDKFHEVMDKLTEKHDWTMVFLEIDGRWNRARTVKTINKFILTGGDDELLTITDEEIEKRCKSYWAYELEKAANNIKTMTFKERNDQ